MKKLNNNDIIKLSCELAHDRTIDDINSPLLNYKCIDIYLNEDSDISSYTPEFQEIFDGWYDYFYNKIINI